MKKSIKLFSTTLVASIMVSSAMAQDNEGESGIYASFNAGAEFITDVDLEGIQQPGANVPGVAGDPAIIEVDFDTGYNVRGGIGYKFSKGFVSFLKPSVELELGYAEADVNTGSFNGGNQAFGGDISVFTTQLNYNNDIIFSDNQPVTPYIGGGLGIAVVDTNITYFANNGVDTAPTFGVFGSSTNFVIHNHLGLKAKINDRFDIFAEGRYTRVSSGDFERRFIEGGANGFSADVSGDTDSFSLGLGLKVRF